MKNISLTEKLILYFLFLGITAIVIVSLFSFYSTKAALMNRTFDQLTSLRVIKKQQIELFFSDRTRDAGLLSASDDTKKLLEMIGAEGWNFPANDQVPEEDLQVRFFAYLTKYSSLKNYFTRISLSTDGRHFLTGSFRKTHLP